MMSPKWINNVRLPWRDGLWQIAIADGKIARLSAQPQHASPADESLDGEGGLACAPFIEPHIHLDTTQTAGEPAWNQSGTLFEGIERWAERKAMLSHEDVKRRAMQTLKWQIANGIQFVRTHVDVSDPSLTALKAMLELKAEMAPWITIQIVAFPQEGILSYPNGEALLEAEINVCFGHDDVFDPWYPLGTASMLQVLHMGLHVCQLMGYEQIDAGLDLITHNSAKTLQLSGYGIQTGNDASLIILPAESGFDAVRRQVPVRYSLRRGIVVAETKPAESEIYWRERERIDFRR